MPTVDEEILGLKTRYRKENNLDLLRAVVGTADGTVVDTTAPGFIWVRLQTSNGLSAPRRVMGPAGRAMSLQAGAAVNLEYDKMGQMRIAEPDNLTVIAGGGNPIAQVVQPTTAATPRLTQASLETLRIIPSSPASLIVAVKGWNPIVSGTPYQFAGAQVDLTSYVPSSGNMRYAVIFVKSDYATTEVFASTARSTADVPLDSADIQECITASTSGSTPVWAIKLIGGQTAITQNDIDVDGIDLRQMVNVAGGGVTAYYQTVQTGGSDMTQRAKLNFIQGDGMQVDVSDSAGNNRTNVQLTSLIAMSGLSGEAFNTNDAIYLNASDNKWYKIDSDATAAVKVSKFRGFSSTTVAGADNFISIRLFGKMSGFTGLTGGLDVYVSTTAGALTQTKPTVSAGGGQKAIIRMGFAIDSAAVFILPSPVEFVKRESLANAASLTIEHYSDPLGRERKPRAYISTTTGGVLTNNATSTLDQGVPLRGGTGAGATNTVTNSTLDGQGIGNVSGTTNLWAQSFQVTAGTLTSFTFQLRGNVGSPSGTMTWEICSDSAGAPGTVLETGTLTPTASATNTVSCSAGTFLAASTTYWLKLYSTGAQSSNNYWSWYCSTTSVYASGTAAVSTNGGSSWSNQTIDMNCAIITTATAPFDRIAQSFQIGSTSTVDLVKLYLKKIGTPTGTLTVRIETNSGSAPSGTLADANATLTYAESSLGTSYAEITFDFTNFSLTGSTTYWIVLSTDRAASASNYVVWGVDASSPGYASGNLSTYASSAYTVDTSRDAIFSVIGPVTTYEEPCVVGRESGGTRDVSCRFDDGAGANADTKTTFTNRISSTADVTAVLELT